MVGTQALSTSPDRFEQHLSRTCGGARTQDPTRSLPCTPMRAQSQDIRGSPHGPRHRAPQKNPAWILDGSPCSELSLAADAARQQASLRVALRSCTEKSTAESCAHPVHIFLSVSPRARFSQGTNAPRIHDLSHFCNTFVIFVHSGVDKSVDRWITTSDIFSQLASSRPFPLWKNRLTPPRAAQIIHLRKTA